MSGGTRGDREALLRQEAERLSFADPMASHYYDKLFSILPADRGSQPQQHQLDGTKRPAALLHVETDVDVVLDALARWHSEQPTDAHPGGFDLCPASPCRDVREAL